MRTTRHDDEFEIQFLILYIGPPATGIRRKCLRRCASSWALTLSRALSTSSGGITVLTPCPERWPCTQPPSYTSPCSETKRPWPCRWSAAHSPSYESPLARTSRP